MKINKIFLMVLVLIAIFSLSAVSASENATADIGDSQAVLTESASDILTDNATQKQELNVEVECADYIVKPDPNDGHPTVKVKNLPDDYHGAISVYVDDNIIATGRDADFEDSVNLRSFDYGHHILLVTIDQTAKYNPLNLTREFDVVEGYIKIDSEIRANEGVTVGLKEGATGYLTVNVDGKEFKKIKIDAQEGDISRGFVSLGTLSKKTHLVEAIYSGDANNKKITKKQNVNVIYDIAIEVETPPKYTINGINANAYGSKYNIMGILISNDATSIPQVTIDGVKFKVTSESQSRFNVDTSLLKPGLHTANITYPGDSKYAQKSVLKNFETVAGIGVKIDDGSDYAYNNTEIFLNLPEDAKGNLNVYVDGQLYKTTPIKDTNAAIRLSNVKLGKHVIMAEYTGDDYDIKNITREIEMIPKATYPKHMLYGSDETFCIETNPDAKLNITVKMDGKTFELQLTDGKANFSLSELNLFEYEENAFGYNEIIITYNGDYNATKSYSIGVDPIPSRLVGSNDITMYYGDSKTYSLTVWGIHGEIVGAGERVTVRIGNAYKYPTTDSNGKIKIKIDQVPGTYKVTATYRNAKVTSKIVVKQVLTLKSVKVKRSAKKLVLSATLKNKKVIKGKTVAFKFNGKTYKTKTNSKGIAKVTIKSSILKKLKVGKKVTYQATYLKDTVKKTVKVQR